MNIKALLIYPEMPFTFWSLNTLNKIIGKKATFPPLGLLTIAALFPKDWDISLLDLNINKLKREHLTDIDFVFISAMNVQSESVNNLVKILKNENLTIVAGGPLFAHEYENYKEIDHIFLSEAEILLPHFFNDLKNNSLKKVYKADNFPDINLSPLPRYDLINSNDYLYATIQYSRGCPFLCEFCDVTVLYGRKPRIKRIEKILDELNQIIKIGTFDTILFADDNLIGNKSILKKVVLPELIEWRKKHKFAPAFATQLTINLADDVELMKLMLEAGFRHLFIGIESPESLALAETRKNQNLKRDLLSDLKKLQAFGFIITGGFIVGFDNDSENVFQNQIDFINDAAIIIPTVNLLKAPPGTELYKRLEKENRIIKEFNFDENKTNIKTILPENLLFEGYSKILVDIYSAKSVYQRINKYFANYNPPKIKNKIIRKIKISDILIIPRMIYYLGFQLKEKRYFWLLFFKFLIKNPKRLDLIILFGALMLHYQNLWIRFKEQTKLN